MLCAIGSGVRGADEPAARLAAKARLDFLAAESAGELQDGRLVHGDGDADRMNWVAPSAQPRSLTVEIAISSLGWREFAVQFTPSRSGTVTMHLMGPFEQVDGQVVRQEVLWDALSAKGTKLPNGGFEQLDGPMIRDWENHGASVVMASERLAAVEGRYMARTWHNQRLTVTLQVVGGTPVVVGGHARAAIPPGFVEMARIESRDTPAHRAARRFLRGANFGNYLEAPPDQDWGARYSAEDLEYVRAEGFDHVRLPVAWHHYTSGGPEYRIGRGIFARVDSLVDEATTRGIGIIINVHHFDKFTSQPARERAKFLAMWKQIAEHYADAKDNVAFELLNEPKDAATTEVMNDVYEEAIRVIRKSNPRRVLFVGPGKWNSADELPKLKLPEDDANLIVTVHCYSPMYFTHQGASWTGPDYAVTGIQFPGPPATPLRVPAATPLKPHVLDWIHRYNTLPAGENPSGTRAFSDYLRQAQEWSDYYGRPMHVGEFGCIVKADAASRSRYYRAVRDQLEMADIGWALWDWKAGFRYWNPGTKKPEPGMHEALFGK